MKIRYALEARQHLAEIHAYIWVRNSNAAARVLGRIRAAVRIIGEFPHIGRSGSVRGTHELQVKGLPYIIVYEIRKKNRSILIFAVFHGAQER